MEQPPIEKHPWHPFIPEGARVLIMGTFPPGSHRWSMDFYYPNRTNDFWKIMGLLFLNDPKALYDNATGNFNEESIKELMTQRHIALNDTAREVRRLKGNASDKFLEILKPVPLYDLLDKMPDCHTIATTGEKAAGVIAEITGTRLPKMGEMITMPPTPRHPSELKIWRMPSTSRAYPMALEKKAAYYAELLRSAGVL
ncbi:MAG: uracil-DNA glycosylase family protein [Lachnospiraceae bacterium]|nr:uracil-DNA glycosylase family protein [Lachnospiraceae bacterium]